MSGFKLFSSKIYLIIIILFLLQSELHAQIAGNKNVRQIQNLVSEIEYLIFKGENFRTIPALCDSLSHFSEIKKDNFLQIYSCLLKGLALAELKNYEEALKCINYGVNIENTEYLNSFRNFCLGIYNYRVNSFKESLQNLNLAEKYFATDTRVVKNRIILAIINKFKGRLYAENGIYSKALQLYDKSIQYYVKSSFKSNIYEVYRLIGRCYFLNSKFDPELKVEALVNYKKALQGFKKYNLKEELPWMYTNLADYYSKTNEPNLAASYQDSCMILARKDSLTDLIGISFNNYGEINMLKSNYKGAVGNFKSALYYYEKSKNVGNRIVTLKNLAETYAKIKMTDSAENFAYTGLVLALKFGNFDKIAGMYFCLSEINLSKNNYKEAYFFYKKYKQYIDTVYNKQNINIAYTMREIYETDAKENENLLLKNENLEKELRIKCAFRLNILIVAISIILIAMGIFSFYSMKRRKELQLQIETKNLLEEKFTIKEKTLKDTERELHSLTSEIICVAKSIKIKDSEKNYVPEIDILESVDRKMRNIQSGLKSPSEMARFRTKLDAFLFQHKDIYHFEIIDGIDPEIQWQDVNMDIQMHLYRIVQLLLHNTNQHARASEAGINCYISDNRINFMYTDDGIGYNPIETPKDRGLAELSSRIRYLDGTLLDESCVNKGCEVSVEIPLV